MYREAIYTWARLSLHKTTKDHGGSFRAATMSPLTLLRRRWGDCAGAIFAVFLSSTHSTLSVVFGYVTGLSLPCSCYRGALLYDVGVRFHRNAHLATTFCAVTRSRGEREYPCRDEGHRRSDGSLYPYRIEL